ncbi:hypothetical protein GOODEAATRI_002788 [Goodea atripinnis]|uniref:Uncharacterized protein n=1 Tax=Goodea atripinnis TaxID=208336 RepID=A0ABV0PKA6_9TELE
MPPSICQISVPNTKTYESTVEPLNANMFEYKFLPIRILHGYPEFLSQLNVKDNSVKRLCRPVVVLWQSWLCVISRFHMLLHVTCTCHNVSKEVEGGGEALSSKAIIEMRVM